MKQSRMNPLEVVIIKQITSKIFLLFSNTEFAIAPRLLSRLSTTIEIKEALENDVNILDLTLLILTQRSYGSYAQ